MSRRRGSRTKAEIDAAVRDVSRTSIDTRELAGGAVDLSPEAMDARRVAADRVGDPGGGTGRDLYHRGRRVYEVANQIMQAAKRRHPGRLQDAMIKRATDAMVTAAYQIRVAQITPLDRGYLHVIGLDKLQTIEREVTAAADRDLAALAVDTHRRINDQKMRIGAEGETT